MPYDPLAHQLLFVGGKGGVGKTTTAAAIALAAAERGRRCLVVSTDPAHSLGDIFERAIGDSETALAPNLTGLEVDPDAAATAHIQTVSTQMKRLVHPRLYDEIDRQMALAREAPGAVEAALLERVASLMGEAGARFDMVVFDTAPSGHTVRLLTLPDVMAAWMDGLLRQRDRASRLGKMLGHLGGGRVQGDDLSLIDEAADHPPDSPEARVTALLHARRRTFVRARERLLDTERTAFLLVVNPDRLSILESRRIVDTLGRFDLPVAALVVNRVLPETADASGSFFEDRRNQEQAYVREIAGAFAPLPRIVVPLGPRDVHGIDALRDLGAHLCAT
ncbi:MAG: ArsA family ATPase [Acidobacteria bacterium]|nr:ArsA family ATPase [Acidobacteriota bacterium]MYD69957.1 ArsA family ATPase [Acidobacteriota bacterium]MYJ05350.1 ArsA family ATPase [Acidobacteriota bacterium]